MDGLVLIVARHVVQQHDRRVVLCEIVLERKHLAPVAQRALRQQANFRQAVDDDANGLQPFDCLEHALDRFSELQIGGIKEALMLIGVENAVRWHQLEDFDVLG